MDLHLAQGFLLAIGNGLVCLLLPAILSWTQRKWKQDNPVSAQPALSQPELASQEAH